MKIVAFGHERRTGKDTAAAFLYSSLKSFDGKLKIFRGGFADAVKEQSWKMFSWAGLHPGVYYESNGSDKEKVIPKLGVSARDIWIHVGEEMRKLCPTMWVELLLEKVPLDTKIMIISDLRKIPEANFVLDKGGDCYKMIRESVTKHNDPVDSELRTFNKWKGFIENNGSLKDLMSKIHVLGEELYNGVR